MKRRKKHVWLIVYPFEYPALQAYLNVGLLHDYTGFRNSGCP